MRGEQEGKAHLNGMIMMSLPIEWRKECDVG